MGIFRRTLYGVVWHRGQGITPAVVESPTARLNAVHVRYDDGKLTSVVGYHRTLDDAERLVAEHVRHIMLGPQTS